MKQEDLSEMAIDYQGAAALVSSLFGRRSNQPAGASGGTGKGFMVAAPCKGDTAVSPQGVRAQLETAPVAPVAGATDPGRRSRIDRSRRLWSREDGFTMSGSRAVIPSS